MIPTDGEAPSKAVAFLAQVGWNTKPSGVDHLAVEVCPLCGHDNFKFFVNVSGGEKDGVWDCKPCGESGNLYQLKERLGLRVNGVMSMNEAATAGRVPPPLPDINAAHWRLVNDAAMGEVLDYLLCERGFTMDVIEKYKLGAEEYNGKKWFVIPYLDKKGNPVYVKQRTVPPAGKEFRSSAGREAPLFNEAVLQPGLEEVIFVEGEADCLALLSAGAVNVVGVPGANTKKANWITKLDEVAPKKIYLLYDTDKVGQKAAEEMGKRIGIEKVFNIVLPPFKKKDGTDGKDINDWLMADHTLEELEALKASAKPFNVEGVYQTQNVLEDLRQEILGRETMEPKYKSPWPGLTRKGAAAEEGDVIDIIAQAKIGKTTAALNWADFITDFYGDSAMVYCLEMTQTRMARKWVSYVTQTDDTPPKTTEEAVKKKEEFLGAIDKAMEIAANRRGHLLFAHTKVESVDQVFDTIRQAVRRYNVKFVVFDNLQLLCDLTLKGSQNRTVHLSQISKRFKALATELGIVIIRIVQPNRVRDGEIVNSHNADGASQIEKDCDAMIVMHRKRVGDIKDSEFNGMMETDSGFEPQVFCKVDLSRYAPGGIYTLYIDGAKSTVREFSPEDINAGEMPKTGGAIPVESTPIEA